MCTTLFYYTKLLLLQLQYIKNIYTFDIFIYFEIASVLMLAPGNVCTEVIHVPSALVTNGVKLLGRVIFFHQCCFIYFRYW